jgi:hypothetical protein
MSQDPYYGVRDNVKSLCDRIKVKSDKFLSSWRRVNTATNAEFKDLRKGLIKDIRGAEKQLRDLKGAIDMVEANRAKFPSISNPELGQRKLFVSDMDYTIQNIKQGIDAQEIRQKLQSDDASAKMESSRPAAMPTSSRSKESSNDTFIHNQRQTTHQIINQQDMALTDLGASVDRLGDMGRTINEELREQNRMLDDLDDDLDAAGNKMNFVMSKLAKLLKTKDGCLIWTIIILTFTLCLLIALVIWT